MAVRRLRSILLRYAPVVVLLPFLFMLLLGGAWLVPLLRHDRDQHQRQFALAVATQIENYLSNSRTAILALAALLPDAGAADFHARAQQTLDAAVQHLDSLQACYLVGQDGHIEYISVSGGNRQQDLTGVDLSLNRLVRTALTQHRPLWSDSYLSIVRGGISVALAVPVGKHVLIGELELENLSRYLAKVTTISTQKIFVLDRRGQVIADRDGSYTAQQMNLGNLPVVQKGPLDDGRDSETFDFEGRRMVGGLFKIPDTSWSVLVAQGWDDVNRPLITSGRIVGAGLLSAMLLLAALTFYFTRLLIRRLEMLAGHARLVAESPEIVPWPNCSIAEFNTLADSLSGMAWDLRERATLLEEEVCERRLAEKALLKKNEELARADDLLREQVAELSQAQETLKQREEERRALEQQVLQQQKLEGIGLLAGGIAHDFNNMLCPILICAELIEKACGDKKCGGEKAVIARAAMIREAGTKAKDLVKQLLTFSRKQDLQRGLHDLNDIVDGFLAMLRRAMRENITFITRLTPLPCPVLADRTQLEQVLLNLAVNASDAIDGPGRMTLETAQLLLDEESCRLHPELSPGRYIMLTFSDTGRGMDQGTLAHVFEPFFTTKPVGKGTGLGLSTTYGIIRQHGGTIAVQSAVGAGTTFTILLPLAEEERAIVQECEVAVASQGASDATVIVVEDNAMVLEMVREILENCGYTVLAASLPEDAREVVESYHGEIDLLLSDVVMPQMSGPELHKELVGLRPGLRALFMTGYASSAMRHKGQLQEGVNVLAKPFSSEALLKMVAEILALPRQR